jgi:hypothetical protein
MRHVQGGSIKNTSVSLSPYSPGPKNSKRIETLQAQTTYIITSPFPPFVKGRIRNLRGEGFQINLQNN